MKSLKIISGGQTGADRAALDFAIERGFDYGGFVPKGRRAEDGKIAEKYDRMTETDSRNYEVRTKFNVSEADITIILTRGALSGGSLFTWTSAKELGEKCLHFDLDRIAELEAAAQAARLIHAANHKILNIAGPRASSDSSIYASTKNFLILLAEKLDELYSI